eukprot:754524-Hanusia_phi.AAC.2
MSGLTTKFLDLYLCKSLHGLPQLVSHLLVAPAQILSTRNLPFTLYKIVSARVEITDEHRSPRPAGSAKTPQYGFRSGVDSALISSPSASPSIITSLRDLLSKRAAANKHASNTTLNSTGRLLAFPVDVLVSKSCFTGMSHLVLCPYPQQQLHLCFRSRKQCDEAF